MRGFVTKSGDFSSFQVGGNGSLREDWKFQVFVTKSGGIGSLREEFFQPKVEELEVFVTKRRGIGSLREEWRNWKSVGSFEKFS